MLRSAVFFAFLSLYCVESLKHPDEVGSLPGLTFPLNYRHYSGYLNATDGKFLHYWFVESQRSPSTDPLLLWLQGGQGCSSLDGFLSELGPLLVSPDGKTLLNNTYSWNREANVIFLEAPAGAGFSYSLSKDYRTDDDLVAKDNYAALQHFFEKFPHFKKNDFYITGESYAGIYVPTLSLRVLNGPAKINLKGFAIGNGYLDVRNLTDSIVFFAYYHGLVGPQLWEDLGKYCCDGIATTANCNFYSSTHKCNQAVSEVAKIVNGSGLNMYNLYADCAENKLSLAKNSRYSVDKRNIFRLLLKSHNVSKFEDDTPCIDSSNLIEYLNQPDVRVALHIPSSVQAWDACSSEVENKYQYIYTTMRPQVLQLIEAGMKGLIYNGDVDMACNFLGDQWFAESLGLKVIENYKEWKYNNQVAGFVKRYDGLTFVTIKGSGHMVPQDKPGPAFEMISNFLNDEKQSSDSSNLIRRTGRLQKLTDSPSSVIVSWKINDFFNLDYSPSNGVLSEDFDIPGGMAFIGLHPDGEFIRFWITFLCPVDKGMRNPEIECEAALKTDKGTFHKSLVTKDSEYLANGGGYFKRYFELSEITAKKDSLVPGGVLTVKIELKTKKNEDNPPKSSDSSNLIRRTGRLQKITDSPSSVVVAWKINDFFNLDYSPSNGVLSEDFDIPGGMAFIGLHPDGEFIRFWITFLCPVNKGMRNPEIECEAALKTDKGTFHKSLETKDSEYLANGGGYFMRYFELSEITAKKDSLVPRGVLTVKIELKTKKNEDHPPKNSESTDDPNTIGELQKVRDLPSSVVVTWKIKDFFNLEYSPTSSAISQKFDIPGGWAFIALHPDGDASSNKQDYIRFMVVFVCPASEGMRKPEIRCDVALNTDKGIPYKSLASKDSEFFGASGGYFLRYFKMSEVTARKESLVPGGALTVKIELKT